ncbi:MAG: DUF4071 domain-containing protein, partial [Nitrospirales bacterium]|nr:DUF4071 domain-containing protein [Nitrospirales bacterium]
ASYAVIKEAIEDAGLECYRADELRSNALIDQVMYDQLLNADLVVADITTLNFNAGYELGVRYALRPYATLVVGEKGMNFPFDVNHIYIHKYQHLGEDMGYQEVKRFRAELKELAHKAVSISHKDSPVYLFLSNLPEMGFLERAQLAQLPVSMINGSVDSLRQLTDQAKVAMSEDRFSDAVDLWHKAREIGGKNDYLVQQLALATYKSKQPDAQRALRKAETILEYLKPHSSLDTETLGLWAAVHKRLYELNNDARALEEAIFALERGFFIKQDYYNGINLAFMLDTKAAASDPDLKVELRAMGRYLRRKVKDICDKAFVGAEMSTDEKYWIVATLYEACVGLGEADEASRWKVEVEKLSSMAWMCQSTEEQIKKLRALIE